MQNKKTVAVAGCGPAGLAAALFLHRLGHEAVLYDQLEAPAPIGSGLIMQPTGLAVLDALGLGGETRRRGRRIDRLFGRSAATGGVVLDVKYRTLGASACGIGVHRGALFKVLFDAVKAQGVTIETSFRVTAVDRGPKGVALVDQAGASSPRFDLIVDALGARSPLAPPGGAALAYGALWASLDWPAAGGFDESALEQRYESARKMVGVLPIGRVTGDGGRKAAFFWSLRTDAYEQWRAQGLEKWKDDVRALWPETEIFLDQINDAEALVFARYAHKTVGRPFSDRVIHIGDAAHSTSPQLGQGANMALLDAAALAAAMDSGELDGLGPRYWRMRGLHIRLYQLLSRWFTPFYQSDRDALPFIRDRIVNILAVIPPGPSLLAAMVAGALGAPVKRIPLPAAPDARVSKRMSAEEA